MKTPDEIVAVCLRRLIAAREILGYELAAERGLCAEKVRVERLRAYHDDRARLPLDPRQVAATLRAVLGEMPEPDVVAVCAVCSEHEALDAIDAVATLTGAP